MYQKVTQNLRKVALLSIVMFISSAINAQKPKLAVMDFMAGVGLYQNDVNGLSDMLINSLFNTGKFELIERGQLCELIGETNLQKSSLSAGQLQQLAIKGVNFLLLGTVNLTGGEYNIDIRVVDVGTGQLYSTAGVTKLSTQTYRDMMPKLADELATKLPQVVNATVTVSSVPEKPKKQDVIILLGYLSVFPQDIPGHIKYSEAMEICNGLNASNSYGYNDWRLPTIAELRIMCEYKEEIVPYTKNWYMSSELRENDSCQSFTAFDFKDSCSSGANGTACYASVRFVRTNR